MKIAIKSFLRFLRQYQYLSCNIFFKKHRSQSDVVDSISQSIIDQSHDEHPITRFPDHIVVLILQNLNIPDRTRATLVCKSWKNILTRPNMPPPRDEVPWLITTNDSYREPESFLSEIHLKSSSEQRIYRFKLPNPYGDFGGGYLCGSSRGWLLIATGPDLNPYMFLWNPISGSIRKFPPLSTLPFFDELVEDSLNMLATNVSCLIPRMDVNFSVGPTECVVAAIFRNPLDVWNWRRSDIVALCTPRDKEWTVFRGHEKDTYHDILFHNGKLHTLTGVNVHVDEEMNGNEAVEIIRLSDGCEVELQPIVHYNKIPSDYDIYEEEEYPLGMSVSPKRILVGHLVESCPTTGELLYIEAVHELFKFKNDGGPIETFGLHQTAEFRIRLVKEAPLMEDMCSVGEQVIFVGTTGSVAVKGGDGGGGDRIYFATDGNYDMVGDDDDEVYVVREQGVFYVQEKRIQRTSYVNLEYPVESKIGWFTPKLL